MSDLTIVRGKQTAAQKILAFFGKGFVNFLLVFVAIFWLVPSVGLFISSLRTVGDSASTGWWTVFTTPAQLTVDNYVNLLSNTAITGSFWNTIMIAVPTTVLVVVIGALAGYAFAWLQFPGRDWLLIVVIVLLAVPIQVALIPLARMFGALGIFGSVLSVILFHIAFGLPFAIFLLRNFLCRFRLNCSKPPVSTGRATGASSCRSFFRSAARPSPRWRSSSFCGPGMTCWWR